MRILKNLSIRTKLIFLATISACVAILLTSAAFVFNDMSVMRTAKVRQTRLHVDMMHFSDSSMTKTEDDDREDRRHQYLRDRLQEYLGKVPTVTFGCLYDTDGAALATYHRDVDSDRQPPVLQSFGESFGDDGGLELFHPIRQQGEQLATMFVHDDAGDVRLYFLRNIKIALYVTLFSCLLALLLSIRLQSLIARPIQELVGAVKRISKDDNTAPPVKIVAGTDEISMLERSFYQMLHEVHEAKSELENRVEQRTGQLRMEIAERKKIEVDLVRARDGAQEANRSKSAFLANMSHEIRTPLNAILGFSELLKKGIIESEHERDSFLTTIISSGKHLLELINGILDLSKIESGQMEMERRRFSPDHVIASALSVMHVKAAEKDLELTYQWSSGVPETIENDEARMRQALINLIGNAIKFTEKGGVHVTCRLIVDQVPAMVEVGVRDTGIGIPVDKVDSVFEPFVQADASVTRKFGGTGLGLAITRRIAELLGGSLRVVSQVGVGSEFTISMTTGQLNGVPIRSEPIATIDATETVDEMVRTNLTGSRVLVVEDVPANRKLIRIILSRAGAEVHEAENGALGYDAAIATPFDVVLMDMQMPVMDGYQATRKLRENGYTGPIIALTANAMKGDDAACLQAGCNGYLAKPIDTNDVLSTVREAAGQSIVDSPLPGTQGFAQPTWGMASAPPPKPAPSQQTTSSVSPIQDVLFGQSSGPVFGVAGSPQPSAGGFTQAANQDPIRSRLPADDADFCEIIVEFIDRVRIQLPEIRQAAISGDFESVERLAHMIKGTGGSAGFPAFTKPASDLSKLARQRQPVGMDAIIDELAILVSRLEYPS